MLRLLRFPLVSNTVEPLSLFPFSCVSFQKRIPGEILSVGVFCLPCSLIPAHILGSCLASTHRKAAGPCSVAIFSSATVCGKCVQEI